MSDSSVVSSIVGALVQHAARLGVTPAVALEKTGIDPAALSDADARIPSKQYLALWELLLAIPNQPFLGLDIGRSFRLEVLGVVGLAMSQSETVRDSNATLERYGKLANSLFMPRGYQRKDRAVWELKLEPRLARVRHRAEGDLALVRGAIRELAGASWKVRALEFQHPRPPDISQLVEYFGVEPRFGADASRLEYDAALLDARPSPSANPGKRTSPAPSG